MRKGKKREFAAIVMGASAGGLDALSVILPSLNSAIPVPVVIVQHISPSSDLFMVTYLHQLSDIRVKEVSDKMKLKPSTVYIAPPDYHVLIEENQTLALSNEEKVNFSRPSIDVLFETASWVYKERLIGVLLTGANWDGAKGVEMIKESGGYTIIQDPATAAIPRMPQSALDLIVPDKLLPLEEIALTLNKLCK